MDIKCIDRPVIPSDYDKLGFGKYFAGHMFMMDWSKEKGWHDPRIVPYGPLVMDPAAMVLHYGQGIFEGLKAYYIDEDTFGLFRPNENAKRFNRSAKKLDMPTIPAGDFLQAVKVLVKHEASFIPRSSHASLYIRPTMIATESALGVRASNKYLFYIILSPSGPYFKNGFAPTKIYVTGQYARAADRGLGDAKTMANYAASIKAGQIAKARGYDQVLWLDGKKHMYVEEVGSMNIFFVNKEGHLITPALSGTILPGITRDSVIKLASEMDLKVIEHDALAVGNLVNDIKDGQIVEAFGTGTAAVISPVGELYYKFRDETVVIGDGSIGPLTREFYGLLMDIQGDVDDRYHTGWLRKYKM